ncbi:MAG TPA: hypothetical protein VKX25_20425 [Bryobacteraceae bacterium]|nr:hypothetical protein [Bryobacteraceae bacterium]
MATDEELRGGLVTQGDFGTIDAEDAGATAGSAFAGDDFGARDEAEFHETAGDRFGQV